MKTGDYGQMPNETAPVYIVAGEAGVESVCPWADLTAIPVSALAEQAELPAGIAVITAPWDEAKSAIGAFFRQKKPFVLAACGDMTPEDLERLVATAKKRKARAWILGGTRVLPLIAAAKEIIDGGCLGADVALDVSAELPESDRTLTAALARDAARWLAGRYEHALTFSSGKAALDGWRLTFRAEGKAGWIQGEYDTCEKNGRLVISVNGHERTKLFGAADTLAMEMTLVRSLAVSGVPIVPGLVLLRTLELPQVAG